MVHPYDESVQQVDCRDDDNNAENIAATSTNGLSDIAA
jgi:hypothetical protein